MSGWKEEGKWLKAARELDFTPEQRKRVLAARDEALGILHECGLRDLGLSVLSCIVETMP